MKTELYEYFLTLAEERSFSKAAQKLPFTQAALTQKIQQMEAALGVPLFDRTTRKLELSEYGKIMRPHAQRIVQLKNEALAAISRQQTMQTYDLTVGFYPTASRYNFVEKMNLFRSHYPEINTHFRELLPAALIEAMERGEFDFIICEESSHALNPNFDRLKLDHDVLAAVIPASHPLANYQEVLLSQLAKERFLMLPENTFVYHTAISACKAQNFTPSIAYTSYSIKNILEMVGQGSGVSLLVKKPAESFRVQDVSVIRISPPVVSSVNLLYRKDRLTSKGKVFLDFMKEQTALSAERSEL